MIRRPLNGASWIGRSWRFVSQQIIRNRLVIIGTTIVSTIIVLAVFPAMLTYFRANFAKLIEPETLGRIAVDSPEVYTRERLVNDRFEQVSWLDQQLRATKDESRFRAVDARIMDRILMETQMGMATHDQPSTSPDADQSATPTARDTTPDATPDSAAEPKPSSLDQYRAMNSFRDEIRTERMQTLMDDRHDIEGNTIYYLTFDTTVIAGSRTRKMAAVKVRLSHAQNDYKLDYNRLYEDWNRHLSKLVNESINDLVSLVERNQLDIDLYGRLYDFIEWKLCRNLILASAPGASDVESVCFESLYQEAPHSWAENNSDKDSAKLKHPYDASYFAQVKAAVKDQVAGLTDVIRKHRDKHAENRYKADSADLSSQGANPPDYRMAKYYCLSVSRSQDGDKIIQFNEREIIQSKGKAGKKVREINCPREEVPLEIIQALVWFNGQLDLEPGSGRFDAGESAVDILTSLEARKNDRIKQLQEALYKHCPPDDYPAGRLASCVPIPEDPPALRCTIAQFTKRELEQQRRRISDPNAAPYSLEGFFDLIVKGDRLHRCSLAIIPKADPAERESAIDTLKDELNQDFEVYSYGVTPKNQAQRIASAFSGLDAIRLMLAVKAGLPTEELKGELRQITEHETRMEQIQSRPVVVGFGSRMPVNANASPTTDGQPTPSSSAHLSSKAEFGWVIGPKLSMEERGSAPISRHTSEQYTLAAVLSVPSWWRSVRMVIEHCWLDPAKLDDNPEDPLKLCAGNTRIGGQEVDVRLPGAVNELSRKLRFEVLREPHLRISIDGNNPMLEIGRPGELLLEGERLWRSTTVTLGAQQADEISVLPNMEGIVAKFNCIHRPSVPDHDGSKGTQTQVRVWTSEGVTRPMPVELGSGGASKLCPDEEIRVRAAAPNAASN